MNEYSALPVQLATHLGIGLGKRLEAVFNITVAGWRVVGQGDTAVAHSECDEILGVAGSTVVDGENRADSAGAQIFHIPGIPVGTGSAGEGAGHQPEHVSHYEAAIY